LALSGGAAKGIAHVWSIKALEENEIPIDYIVGTSMGAIIVVLCCRHESEQIEEIVTVKKILLIGYEARTEEGQDYYYFKNENTPSFIRLNLT